MSHSQNDEEQHILGYFDTYPAPEGSHFLDIGAHDGITFSNTWALAERGWTGTLVEPSPNVFPALMKNYALREGKDSLVNVALAPGAPKLMRFYDSGGDMVSTVDEAHRELWCKDVAFRPIYVATVNVEMLLQMFPGPYAFINLDVEGINFQLFKELPLRELGTRLVCVEYQDKLDEIDAHASAQGYHRIHKTSENAIYAVNT